MCGKAGGHVTAADVLKDVGVLDTMCAAARRAAMRQLTVTAAAIAAQTDIELAEATSSRHPETDRLVAIDEASNLTGLSKDQLYRRKDLPFRIQPSPGTVRFSIKGIERWIRVKSLRT